MLTIIVFILILGFLVFVHELGHFVVARKNGIKAAEFGFGFPPRIIGIQFLKKENGKVPRKKYRIIWGSNDGDDKSEKNDLKDARKEKLHGGTVYSLNWFPIGGFVKIKGEDGEGKNDEDSFASKSPWTRAKVLAAGVTMNLVFAWLFFSISFMLGTSQEVLTATPNSQILITSVEDKSPASAMGIVAGDIVSKMQVDQNGKIRELKSVEDLQNYIKEYKGKNVTLEIFRGKKSLKMEGNVRSEIEEGKGFLGIGLSQVETVRYSFFNALWQGLKETWSVILMMFFVIKGLLAGQKGIEVAGIVGVAAVTGQVIPLGLVAILRLVAIFSLNLAIINILPFPALDGGRILFILIEKIKGSPVSQKVEQGFHTAGFLLLMLLMIFVTYKDLLRLDIFAKIKGLF